MPSHAKASKGGWEEVVKPKKKGGKGTSTPATTAAKANPTKPSKAAASAKAAVPKPAPKPTKPAAEAAKPSKAVEEVVEVAQAQVEPRKEEVAAEVAEVTEVATEVQEVAPVGEALQPAEQTMEQPMEQPLEVGGVCMEQGQMYQPMQYDQAGYPIHPAGPPMDMPAGPPMEMGECMQSPVYPQGQYVQGPDGAQYFQPYDGSYMEPDMNMNGWNQQFFDGYYPNDQAYMGEGYGGDFNNYQQGVYYGNGMPEQHYQQFPAPPPPPANEMTRVTSFQQTSELESSVGPSEEDSGDDARPQPPSPTAAPAPENAINLQAEEEVQPLVLPGPSEEDSGDDALPQPPSPTEPPAPVKVINNSQPGDVHPCLVLPTGCSKAAKHSRNGVCMFSKFPRSWCVYCLTGVDHEDCTGIKPELHPCIRVWGKCKYNDTCIFKQFPRCWCLYCCRGSLHLYCDGVTPLHTPKLPNTVRDKVQDHERETRQKRVWPSGRSSPASRSSPTSPPSRSSPTNRPSPRGRERPRERGFRGFAGGKLKEPLKKEPEPVVDEAPTWSHNPYEIAPESPTKAEAE